MSMLRRIGWLSAVFLSIGVPLSFAIYDSGRALHLLVIVALLISLLSLFQTGKATVSIEHRKRNH
jgi:uncharacterized protein (DUF58 family)